VAADIAKANGAKRGRGPRSLVDCIETPFFD
jgi:hypothetical protein